MTKEERALALRQALVAELRRSLAHFSRQRVLDRAELRAAVLNVLNMVLETAPADLGSLVDEALDAHFAKGGDAS